MPSKFRGDLQALKDRLLSAGLDGEWVQRPNRVWQFKFPEGVGLNWSETKGTLWCDGKEELREPRERQIAEILGTPFDSVSSPTIIEKLESVRREANFAVVLATPDDEGHRRDHPEEKAFRVRQNVVLELGMMLAILGRRRVAVLLQTSVEMERPSDIQGIIYVAFKDDVKEAALTLAKEIDSQGIPLGVSWRAGSRDLGLALRQPVK